MIPSQEEADMSKPEEHILWAMQAMPSIAGTGSLCHPAILKCWSKHLVEAGFYHTDYIARLADENGNIHVSRLPKQMIKKIPAFRGPRHAYNNAVTWIPVDRDGPKPMRIPDMRQFTIQENAGIVAQLEEIGAIKKPAIPEHLAEEEN